MKERPILFSGAMVRAILDGRKTQTRRVIKPQPEYVQPDGAIKGLADVSPENQEIAKRRLLARCPYGQPGDRLWVRETWNCIDTGRLTQRQDWVRYRATDGDELRWRPSIFMPRWASRITLEVVSVRVERVRDISGFDALREGVTLPAMQNGPADPTVEFMDLWDSINEKRGYSWAVNPWVWVVEFKQVQQ